MALIDLIDESVIKAPLAATNKPAVLKELVQLLVDAGRLAGSEDAYRALLERERQGSTGLERGIAVPHAKTPAVKDLTISIGVAPNGIDFDAVDGQPSRLFFLLLAAPDKSGPHIEALSEIARLTKSPAFCQTLSAAKSPQEVMELLRE